MSQQTFEQPLCILIAALGGEGGGRLMNWLVAAARNSGLQVQATSVPGVAQRTGSTSYYLEISSSDTPAVFNLVPLPGRVDIVVCSELMETARMMQAGFVSPERTTLIASTSRVFATAEKIALTDGRFDSERIEIAAAELSLQRSLLDLQQLATSNNTYISATLFGALAGTGVLPWSLDTSRQLLADEANSTNSLRGFEAAASAARLSKEPHCTKTEADETEAEKTDESKHSQSLETLITLATDRLTEYQDEEYAELYRSRMNNLLAQSDQLQAQQSDVLEETARRLANWMAYEDIAWVAELKTQPQRFTQILNECNIDKGQIIRITDYLKPRAEEIADMLPTAWGEKIHQRLQNGKSLPFLGTGRRIPSNAAWGYWLLRATASLKRWRRTSFRYKNEQQEIETWLENMAVSLPRSTAFALSLAELPRVRKGYSDTLSRGIAAYKKINDSLVVPAIRENREPEMADALKESLASAFNDDTHQSLNETVVKFYPTLKPG